MEHLSIAGSPPPLPPPPPLNDTHLHMLMNRLCGPDRAESRANINLLRKADYLICKLYIGIYIISVFMSWATHVVTSNFASSFFLSKLFWSEIGIFCFQRSIFTYSLQYKNTTSLERPCFSALDF